VHGRCDCVLGYIYECNCIWCYQYNTLCAYLVWCDCKTTSIYTLFSVSAYGVQNVDLVVFDYDYNLIWVKAQPVNLISTCVI